jgi:hypothetical protein
MFDVLPAVSIAFEQPIAELMLSPERNGGVFAFTLRNHSRSRHYVCVEPEQIAVGWKAAIVGDAVHVLEPGERQTLRLQIERMVTGRFDELLSFSVAVEPFAFGAAGRTAGTLMLHARDDGAHEFDYEPPPMQTTESAA